MGFFKKYWLWVFLILAFCLKGIIYLDPDFGWHLATGQLILNKGIPLTDPFSYTMSAFGFVDHEWLTDTLTAKLYPTIGTIGLSLIWSIIAVGALKISLSRARDLGKIKTVAVLLGAGALIQFFGIRPQVVSWFFLALFLWFLGNWEKHKFIPFATPLLFLFWVSLHGGFAAGIILLPLYLGIKSIRTRKFKPIDLWAVVASIGATFINPYGVGIWREIFRTFFSTSLRRGIAEWLPGITVLIFCLPLLGVLGTYFSYPPFG